MANSVSHTNARVPETGEISSSVESTVEAWLDEQHKKFSRNGIAGGLNCERAVDKNEAALVHLGVFAKQVCADMIDQEIATTVVIPWVSRLLRAQDWREFVEGIVESRTKVSTGGAARTVVLDALFSGLRAWAHPLSDGMVGPAQKYE